MKLYLSSLAIPNEKEFANLFGKKRHIAIIPTAWHVAPDDVGAPFITRTTKVLEDIGFTHATLNLEDYAGKAKKLEKTFKDFSGVWVTGGNTFYLNYWMRESGFDQILPKLLKKGFVYGGESAGAVVAGRTLHGIEILDNPADAPETIWNGLGLVDYGIIPHWGQQKYAGRAEQSFEEMRLFCPVKTLTNAQHILVS